VICFGGLGCGLHDTNNDLGGAINLALAGEYLVVARGTAGVDVMRLDSLEGVGHLDPTGDSDSYDDVSVDGAIVLLHDADDALLSSFRLESGGSLVAVSRDVAVESGPYSGVSVSGGVAIVSGGTCGISRLSVTTGGELAVSGGLEVFRGQPDVTMVPGTSTALLSTHFSGDEDEFVDGQEFGITTLATDDLAVVATAGLAGAGFSDGGGQPASWPVRASIVGDLAFVAHGGGLDLFRIDASHGIERLGHLDLPFQAVDVFAPESGGEAFVVGVPPQIGVVDVGPDGALSSRRTIELGADVRPTAIVASDTHLVVANNLGAPVFVDR
jgi:hypothetical protein